MAWSNANNSRECLYSKISRCIIFFEDFIKEFCYSLLFLTGRFAQEPLHQYDSLIDGLVLVDGLQRLYFFFVGVVHEVGFGPSPGYGTRHATEVVVVQY